MQIKKQGKWTKVRMIKAVRAYSLNRALSRQDYAKFFATHRGRVPSVSTILNEFKSWDDFRADVWGVKPMVWDENGCIQSLRAALPEAVTFLTYRDLAKANKALPNIRCLYQYFEDWPAVMEAVWHIPKEWSPERIEAVLKQHFKKAPTTRELTTLSSKDPRVPTIHYCTKAFGSYAKMQEVVFKLEAEQTIDEPYLIQVMTQQFASRPKSFKDYHDRAKVSGELPMAETYIQHFGSWEKAMLACYPNQSGSNRPRQWSEEDSLAALRRAHQELGAPLNMQAYRQWSTGRQDVPALSTITLYWGKFSIALKMAGLQPDNVAS